MRPKLVIITAVISLATALGLGLGCSTTTNKTAKTDLQQTRPTPARSAAPGAFQSHPLQRFDDQADYYLEMKPNGFFLYMVVYPNEKSDPIFDADQGALWNCMEKIKNTAGTLAKQLHRKIYYPDPDLDNFNFQRDFCTIEGHYEFQK